MGGKGLIQTELVRLATQNWHLMSHLCSTLDMHNDTVCTLCSFFPNRTFSESLPTWSSRAVPPLVMGGNSPIVQAGHDQKNGGTFWGGYLSWREVLNMCLKVHHFSKVCKSLQQCSLCFVIVESPLQRKVHVVLCMANKTLYNGSTKLTTEQAERDKGHLWATVKEEYNKSPVNGKRLWKSSIRICTDLKRDRCLFQCQVHINVKLELKGVLLQERYS